MWSVTELAERGGEEGRDTELYFDRLFGIVMAKLLLCGVCDTTTLIHFATLNNYKCRRKVRQ